MTSDNLSDFQNLIGLTMWDYSDDVEGCSVSIWFVFVLGFRLKIVTFR